MSVLLLSEDDVRQVLTMELALQAVEDGLHEGGQRPRGSRCVHRQGSSMRVHLSLSIFDRENVSMGLRSGVGRVAVV